MIFFVSSKTKHKGAFSDSLMPVYYQQFIVLSAEIIFQKFQIFLSADEHLLFLNVFLCLKKLCAENRAAGCATQGIMSQTYELPVINGILTKSAY